MAEEIEIEHQPEQQRFVLESQGQQAKLTYKISGKTIVFDHTEVPETLQHRGLANKLAEAALGFARAENLRVDAQCRFMEVFIERHKQWQDLLLKPSESHPPLPMVGGTR